MRPVVHSWRWGPDARLLVTTGEDGQIQLWDAARGAPIRKWRGHRGVAASARFSPDGKLLLSTGYEDGTLRLWSVPSGAPVGRPIHIDEVGGQHAEFSPDGRTIAAMTEQRGAVVLIDVATRRVVGPALEVPGGKQYLSELAFSPHGKTIATGTADGGILFWDARARKRRGEPLAGHEDFVRTLSYSPDGSLLASGSEDSTGMLLWDVASGKRVGGPLLAHPGAEANVQQFLGNGSGLLSLSPTEVAVWEVDGATLGRRVSGIHKGRVSDVASSADGRLLVSGGLDDGTVRLWDVARQRPAGAPLPSGVGPVANVEVSADGRLLAVETFRGQERDQIALFEVATRKRLALLKTTAFEAFPQFSPDGGTLAFHEGNGRVALWDVQGGRLRDQRMDADTFGDLAVSAFSPDGRTLVTGGRDGHIRFWDPATGSKLAEPSTAHNDMVRGIAFSPDGTLLATVSIDGNVFLWDPVSRSITGAPLAGVSGALGDVAFSPDGRTLATTPTPPWAPPSSAMGARWSSAAGTAASSSGTCGRPPGRPRRARSPAAT
jgi:WD40 repeat protein